MMWRLCACLCNEVGHHGICQEKADFECTQSNPAWQLFVPGALCHACYADVRRRLNVPATPGLVSPIVHQ